MVCGAGSWIGLAVMGVLGGKVLSQSNPVNAGSSCVFPSNSKTAGLSTPCAHVRGAPHVNATSITKPSITAETVVRRPTGFIRHLLCGCVLRIQIRLTLWFACVQHHGRRVPRTMPCGIEVKLDVLRCCILLPSCLGSRVGSPERQRAPYPNR